MSLVQELGLRKPIFLLPHEVLLNIYYTASYVKKEADDFFRSFGLTDVQFNVLMLLQHQSDSESGLSQAQISDMMLVNRANITTLIDRMEKAGLVCRTAAAGDRRCNIIVMTDKARLLMQQVEPLYAHRIQEIMAGFDDHQQQQIIRNMETIRGNVKEALLTAPASLSISS